MEEVTFPGEQAAPLHGLPASDRLRYRAWLMLEALVAGSTTSLRVSLIALAMVVQTVIMRSPGHFRPADSAFYAVFVPAGTLFSLALCLLAGLPLARAGSQWLRRVAALGGVVALLVLTVFGVQQAANGVNWVIRGQPYTNDGAAMDLYAAKQILHRHNPYFKTNIVAALAEINAPAITTTPLMQGQFRGAKAYPSEQAVQQAFLDALHNQPRAIPPEFESKYNYPAGSFLVILPFLWAGINDMRFLYALAALGIGWYIAFRLPRALRPLTPLLLLGDVPLMTMTAGGQPDPVYGLFLLLSFAEWDSPLLSPLMFGLAVGTKQLAWFFLPFYLILTWRRIGRQAVFKRMGLVGLVFLIMNGPFIAAAPSAYLTSVAGPMSDPMFPLGVGIISLFVSNLLPMVPKVAFTLGEALAWAAGAAADVRWRLFGPAAAIVFAALPLFFAWRSLLNYFYLVPLLTLAVVLAEEARSLPAVTQLRRA